MTDDPSHGPRPALPLEPLTQPDPGYERCYECDGDRIDWHCVGRGFWQDGVRCTICHGSGWCIVCNGSGQLPKPSPLPSERP